MSEVSGPCIICSTECTYHPFNDPWCDVCKDTEQTRHAAQDKTGLNVAKFGITVPTMTRPPKYAITKADWSQFGY